MLWEEAVYSSPMTDMCSIGANGDRGGETPHARLSG